MACGRTRGWRVPTTTGTDTPAAASHPLPGDAGVADGAGSLNARAEHEYVERCLHDAIGAAKDNIAALERQVEDLGDDEKTLSGKLRKTVDDLARNQKRLESLQTVRCVRVRVRERKWADFLRSARSAAVMAARMIATTAAPLLVALMS